jgi:uncharacterized protein (TIGR00255 family)
MSFMIKSMTGFGKSECVLAEKTISIAVRSVNSKQLDFAFHLPVPYRDYESDFRSEIAKVALRGKIDITLTCAMNAGNVAANINSDAVITYLEQLKPVAEKTGVNLCSGDIVSAILELPGVFNIDEKIDDDEEKKAIINCLNSALIDFDKFRKNEGAALILDILKRVENIENLLLQVEPFEAERINQIKTRLETLFNEYVPEAQIDKNRFEQELIYYLEKLDITEEKVRLKQHCDYFRITVEEENPGRKIGFIAQEMGREINTLGSKASDANIQRIVVQMKDELEKIKEQILNIL